MTDSSAESKAVPVLLGLGANVGDPLAQLARALEGLRAFVGELRASSIYRTEPVGYRDQPDFYNLVARGTTTLAPMELLGRVMDLEREIGRERTFRNAPRVIDIDVLDYDGLVSEDPRLTLPHPGIPARGFVLHPLAEVAPEWLHPVTGKTARELLWAAPSSERVQKLQTMAETD